MGRVRPEETRILLQGIGQKERELVPAIEILPDFGPGFRNLLAELHPGQVEPNSEVTVLNNGEPHHGDHK